LEKEVAAGEADERGDAVGPLKDRAALAEGDDVLAAGEGDEFVEPPDAGEGERIVLPRPLGLEVLEAFWEDGPRPVVADVEQVAALRALEERFADAEARAAGDVDALLVGDVGADVDGRPFPPRVRPRRPPAASRGGRDGVC